MKLSKTKEGTAGRKQLPLDFTGPSRPAKSGNDTKAEVVSLYSVRNQRKQNEDGKALSKILSYATKLKW
jgi:hypothetical protein